MRPLQLTDALLWKERLTRKVTYGALCTFVLAFACMLAVPGVAFANEPEVVRGNGFSTAEETYTVKVEVDVTVDADGWDDASITINGIGGNGRYDECWSESVTNASLEYSFDNESSFSIDSTTCCFPKSVDIFMEFGGGFTWRSFEADVTVYVNDVNVASKHIRATSAPFSSYDGIETITIDKSKYPYVEKLYVDAPEIMRSAENASTANVYVEGVDQYGTVWLECQDIYWFDGNSLVDVSGWYTTLTDGQGKEMNRKHMTNYAFYACSRQDWWEVAHEGPKDETVTYTVNLPTNNSIHPVSTARIDIGYQYVHTVQIRSQSGVIATLTGAAGEEVALDYPELVVDGYALEWTLEGGGSVVPGGEGGSKYVFGDSDGSVTAKVVPYSYRVVFDGNGATGGKMGARVVRVGSVLTLPINCFSRTGYVFVGWNTRPDGGGTSYGNMAQVMSLSTVNDDVVTLYAQWGVRTFNVTFVNKITNERTTQKVAYGEAAVPPSLPKATSIDGNRHSLFTGWNRKFDRITANVTVTSKHETKPHNFVVDGDGVTRCAECRVEQRDAGATGSVLGVGSTTVICAGFMVLVAIVAVWYRKSRKGCGAGGDKR